MPTLERSPWIVTTDPDKANAYYRQCKKWNTPYI
jgi:hypothetical protein